MQRICYEYMKISKRKFVKNMQIYAVICKTKYAKYAIICIGKNA
jgi:hypothetical protein